MSEIKRPSSLRKEVIEREGITEMKCSKTGDVLPLSEFRLHSKGYYLSYCKAYEKSQSRKNAKKSSRKVEEKTFTIKTPKGLEFVASTEPLSGGRKATSPDTEVVLYFAKGITRDQVRSAFVAHTGVKYTGISALLID